MEKIKILGFVLGLSDTQRARLLTTLMELKNKGILGSDTLNHPVKYCKVMMVYSEIDMSDINLLKNVLGTSVTVTFDAYVCDSNMGCLTAHINDNVTFTLNNSFLSIDLAIGNNGDARKMLANKTGTRYPIDPITIEMTVGIQIRNPDLTTRTIYNISV